MFKEINELIASGQSVTISIHKTDVNMTVTVLHHDNGIKDEAVKKIKPLHLTGTAEELDNDFIRTITTPITTTRGILTNISEYEKNAEAAASNSKAEKDKGEQISKLLKAAEKLEEDNKLSEALAEYKKVLEIEPNHSKASRKVDELTNKVKQTNLFV